MDGALGARPEALSEGGRRPSLPSGPEGRASDWLPPSGSGPWAGPCWAGLSRWRRLRGLAGLRAGAGVSRSASEPKGWGRWAPRRAPSFSRWARPSGPGPRCASCLATAARPAAGTDRGAPTARHAGRGLSRQTSRLWPRPRPGDSRRPRAPPIKAGPPGSRRDSAATPCGGTMWG